MAEFPAFPLWTDAYLGDTTHLSTFEHGAYLLLLIVMWRQRGVLKDDDRMFAKITRTRTEQWRRLRPVMEPFFHIENGEWRQGRLSDEFAEAERRSETARTNGQKGGRARAARHNATLATPRADVKKRTQLKDFPDHGSDDKSLKNNEPDQAALEFRSSGFQTHHNHNHKFGSIASAIPPNRVRADLWNHLELSDQLCRIAGIRNLEPGPIAGNAETTREWIALGVPIDLIEQTIITQRERTKHRINSLKYFDPQIRRNLARKEFPDDKRIDDPEQINDPILRDYVKNNGRLSF